MELEGFPFGFLALLIVYISVEYIYYEIIYVKFSLL